MRQAAAPVAGASRAQTATWRNRIFYGLLALIAVAPAPLGAAWPLAWEMLALAVAGLLIALLFVPRIDREPLPRALAVPAVLFALVLAYAFLQGLQIGGAWTNPVWDIAAEGLKLPLGGAIAVDPALARDDLSRLLAYAGIFALACLLGRDRNRARMTLGVLTFAGAVYALYGLAVYALGNGTILWFAKSAFRDDLSASFVNPNTGATYFGLVLLAAATDLVAALETLRLAGTWQVRRQRLVQFARARAWQIAALLLIIAALLLTHSHGGVAAMLAGAVALLVAMRVAPSLQSVRYVGWIAIVLALVLIAVLINGEMSPAQLAGLDRGPGGDSGGLDTVSVTWQAAKDFAFLGTGLGSFAEVFQIYRPETMPSAVTFAHDGYLQNLLELGMPAALCLFAVIAWLAAICLRGVWWRNRDAVFPALGFAATVLVASHAFTGVGLQVPAVAASYLLILGVAVAQSRPTTTE